MNSFPFPFNRITGVGREDKGMYQCVVRRQEGDTFQASAELQLGGELCSHSDKLTLNICYESLHFNWKFAKRENCEVIYVWTATSMRKCQCYKCCLLKM